MAKMEGSGEVWDSSAALVIPRPWLLGKHRRFQRPTDKTQNRVNDNPVGKKEA